MVHGTSKGLFSVEGKALNLDDAIVMGTARFRRFRLSRAMQYGTSKLEHRHGQCSCVHVLLCFIPTKLQGLAYIPPLREGSEYCPWR